MANTPDTLTHILGLTATFTTIGQFLSGIATIQKVRKQGSAGNISPLPFLMGTVGCSLWLAYGKLNDDSMVVYCNIIGTLLNAIYVLIFMQYVTDKAEFQRQIFMALTFLFGVLGFAVTGDPAKAVDTLGLICVIVTLACCASPLAGLGDVIKNKSTESLPFPLISSTFVVCLLWWVYGYRTGDKYAQITNLLGGLIALVQLTLFAIYPSTSNVKDAKKKRN